MTYKVTITHQRPIEDSEDEPNFELELHNSRHTARVWETVSGWVWSCKRCEARGVGLESMPAALTDAVIHMRSEVPWWRKAFDR